MSTVARTRMHFGAHVTDRLWLLPTMLALSAVALGISGYLAWVGLTGNSVAGCDGNLLDCSHVLTSRWSKLAGWPVALPATILYAMLIPTLLLIKNRESNRLAAERYASLALTLTTSAALAAVWFIGLQAFAVGHWCPYCMVAHACGLILAVMSWRRFSVPHQGKLFAGSVSLLGLIVLIVVQSVSQPPPTFRVETHDTVIQESTLDATATEEIFDSPLVIPDDLSAPGNQDLPSSDGGPQTRSRSLPSATVASGESVTSQLTWLGLLGWTGTTVLADPAPAKSESEERLVSVVNGRTKLRISQWPLYGNVKQKYVIAEMLDYNCDHCRMTHQAIKAAKELLGGELAVLVLPTPLHQSCNPNAKNNQVGGEVACELAKLSIAVWLVDRERFAEMHDWLLVQERQAPAAKTFAESLVDKDKLAKMLVSEMPGKFIAANAKLYAQAGGGTLPKLMTERTTLVGQISDGKTVANLVQ